MFIKYRVLLGILSKNMTCDNTKYRKKKNVIIKKMTFFYIQQFFFYIQLRSLNQYLVYVIMLHVTRLYEPNINFISNLEKWTMFERKVDVAM